MPANVKPGSTGLGLSDMSGSLKGEDADELEFVEVDPTGRYGRYKEVLGKGAFKTVYRAFDQEDGIEVAWNQVQIQNVAQTAEDVDRLYSEVNLLKTLKHKNIIKFYHSWVDKRASNINFITEIFTSGTLIQFRKRHKHVEIKAVKKWSGQILRGLLYLHSHDPPIIHRDLKCDNIFIHGNQGEVKIGDLGLATLLHHAHAARSIIGTPEFMAPELYEEEYTELVDIYSFGMCLLEMVTAEYPYSECTNAAQIYKKVISGKKPEALKKVKDPELYQFIEKCLAPASSRLPARELLMDPFLQCEESTGDCTSHIGRMKSDNSAEFNESTMSATVQISYKLKETLSSNLNDCGECYVAAMEEVKTASHGDPEALISSSEACTGKHAPISIPKEDRNRSVDFRVKGKRREDDTVFLNLRIADAEGKVSNIHFPFDVESDTAMCVASEMVAELDLSDQDVTKIAEMIDAAILALVPEWRPGVAVDETYCDGEASIEEGSNDHYSLFEPLTTILNDAAQDFSSPSFSEILTASEAMACSLVDGTAYGRFEEVKYQRHRPLECVGTPDEECTVSSKSSDAHGKERMDLINGCSSPRCYEGDTFLACETYNRIEEIKCDSGIRDVDDDDEAQELRELMLSQEQEMQDLQCKHEQALLDFKKRWQQRKNMKLCSSSGVGSNCADSHQDMGDAAGQFFSEAESTSKVHGVSSLIGGLSSLLTGESLPLSPLTDGRDCKLLTLQAQTETEGRTRCLTIQSQVMEQVA